MNASIIPENATNKNITWSTSDSNVATVENGTVRGVNAGTAKITVTTEDGGYKAECNVVVKKPTLVNIQITNPPNKKEYIEEENFDRTGMKIVANYSNGTSKEITDYNIPDNDDLTLEKESVTISYTDGEITKTIDQPITVKRKSLVSIEISKQPDKTEYIEEENFDEAGMKIKANYDNGKSYEIAEYELIDCDNLPLGKTEIEISYTENEITKTTKQPITVRQKKLVSIEIVSPPNKTEYIEEQDFEDTGLKIQANYDNGKSRIVKNYILIDKENLPVGKTGIIISYTENEITKTVIQPIIVKKKKLVSIDIINPSFKTNYTEGEVFDTTGMRVIANYDNGTSKEVTNYVIYGGNVLTTDKRSIIINYTEDGITKSIEQAIIVNERNNSKVLLSISIKNKPDKTTYMVGEKFDSQGMIVEASYSDGSIRQVINYNVVDGDNLTIDQTEVTISYTEGVLTKTAKQKIEVIENNNNNTPDDDNTPDVIFNGYSDFNMNGYGYLNGVKPNTTKENMLKNIQTNGLVTVFNNNDIVNSEDTITTGMKVKIDVSDRSGEYTIIVKGDVNKDGKVDINDILQVNKHRLKKTTLPQESQLAGDVNNDEIIDIKDILIINKYRLGKIDTF